MAQIPSGGGGGGGSGTISISDVSVPGGSASDKVWQDGPGNTILQSATVSALSIEVDIRSSYPLVTVAGVDATLSPVVDNGHYEGTVPVTLLGDTDILATAKTGDDVSGATDTCSLVVSAPPNITVLNFTGGYPGSQTEVKEDDNYDIAVTADKLFDRVRVLNYEACKVEEFPVGATLSTTVSATIDDEGDSAVLRPARVQVRDSVTAAWSATADTDDGGSVEGVNLVKCNNLNPSGSISSYAYPGIQEALKAVELGTVNHTAANFDTIAYTDPTGTDITIANDTTFEAAKQVTCRNPGDFNNSSTNFRYTMNRAANDATTVVNGVVVIADTPVVITVSFSGARIRSGVTPGADTTITISGNQPLLAAPSLDPAASRGTFQGSWAGGPTSWTRALRVPDSENPANGSSNTWLNLVATNLAGTVTNTITTGPTYVIGGFTSRTINFAPFTANSTETFPLTTEGNLSVGVFSNGNTGVIQPYGTADTTDVGKEGWCAPTAASGVAVNMRMLHTPTVAANSGGVTLTLVQESA